MTNRRAKIVCTIGPATSTPKHLKSLAEAGMDVARLNFSHGSHEEHGHVITTIREIAAQVGRPLAILQDLQGPKIRIGGFASGSIVLAQGAKFEITTADILGNENSVSTSYHALSRDVAIGDYILLSDGLLRLEVVEIRDDTVMCIVRDGGVLHSRAGMNIPAATLTTDCLTPKDLQDLNFGLSKDVDYVALSFVRRAEDIESLTAIIRERGSTAGTIAKLEKPQAIENLDSIMTVSDAVMIARGDLGVELMPERVPFVQKEIIRRAASHRIPVITATQMLESMTDHPQPTRAEASDVANAILDGTDAVMLSGETAVGKYPIESTRMMHRIVTEAETQCSDVSPIEQKRRNRDTSVSYDIAIAQAASRVAGEIKAAALIALTKTGFTARLMSKQRPRTPIFAFVGDGAVTRQLCLYWGVEPRLAPDKGTLEEKIILVDNELRLQGFVRAEDALVVVASQSTHGKTNLIRIHTSGQPDTK